MRFYSWFFALPVLLISCGPTQRVDVPISHPAHPDAVESPVPERSSTLAFDPHPQEPSSLSSPSAADEPEHHTHGPKKDP